MSLHKAKEELLARGWCKVDLINSEGECCLLGSLALAKDLITIEEILERRVEPAYDRLTEIFSAGDEDAIALLNAVRNHLNTNSWDTQREFADIYHYNDSRDIRLEGALRILDEAIAIKEANNERN